MSFETQTLLSKYQTGAPGIPMVGAAEWNALRLGVVLDPAYFLRGPAGVFGTLAGARYAHNG